MLLMHLFFGDEEMSNKSIIVKSLREILSRVSMSIDECIDFYQRDLIKILRI